MADGPATPLRIEDYALIGDTRTAALVGRNGSIDWLCWPRFDSGACFAALLGTGEHGHWRIAPADPAAKASRRYLDDTLVLETVFQTAEGAEVAVTDWMPPRDHGPSSLLRRVTGVRGRVAMDLDIVLRFDYGSAVPWVTRLKQGHGIRAVAGPDMVVLRAPIPLQGEDFRTLARFDVAAGDSLCFELSYAASHRPPPAPIGDADESLEKTVTAWQAWAAQICPAGRWTEAVRRSALTLKALTYAPTGGIVAAPTTSLPEEIGGVRNWDYRFCWLRDATLTLLALLRAGRDEDARAWRAWLLRAVMGRPDQIRIMYGLGGERRLPEFAADWLPGYEGSRPVRIGNAAHEQLQLDVFGELMNAMHQAHRHGLAMTDADWALQYAVVQHLEAIWRQPDHGIWEIRGEGRQYTYSKAMAWAALDRAVRGIETFGLHGPLERWRALRAEIHADVCREGFDATLGSFTQSYGSRALDASLLLLPAIGFLPPDDPRILGTIAAVERHLVEDGLVRRYRPEAQSDGLPGGEGVFLACSFWLADAWAMTGRGEEARRLFERLLEIRNDLGLLSEEYDLRARRMLGNFPQAFSHVALMNTAYRLAGDYAKPGADAANPGPSGAS